MRFILIFLTALLTLGATMTPAQAVSLKESSLITDKSIMLSDIFYDLPRGADKELGPAPRPGKDMILNARTLQRIAMALDLNWRPSSSSDYIVLKSAATVIDAKEVEKALEDKAREQGLEGDFRLIFANSRPEIILPADQEARFEVTKLNLRPDHNYFEAYIVAPSADTPIFRSTFSGSIEKLIEVPVLIEALRNGTVIGARDIEMITLRKKDIKNDFILNPDHLIGMTPKRVVMPGEPVGLSEVQPPLVVERGDTVTMEFQNGILNLTALGKAMESGAKGDVIRVINESSNKTIEAEVMAQKLVRVKTF